MISSKQTPRSFRSRNRLRSPHSEFCKEYAAMNFDKFCTAERLQQDGKREEAISAYTDFITRHTCQNADNATQEKLALAYNNRGFLYYLKVEFELAVQDYTQALRHNDSLAVAFYNRGLVHYRMSRFFEAVDDMKKALALQSDLEPAQKCLQQSLKDLKLKDEQCGDQS